MLPLLHQRLAVTAILFTLVMALWAFVAAARGRGLDGNYMGAIVIGELVLILQSALGALLLLGGHANGLDRPWLHILYGLLAVLIWPFLFTYTRRQSDRRESILFAAGSLFLWGLAMRAAETGHVPGLR
jgi:hypothetical protein